jgi:hypothetical protein
VNVVSAPMIMNQTPYNLYDLFQTMPDNSKTKGMRLCPSVGLSVYCQKGEMLLPGIN